MQTEYERMVEETRRKIAKVPGPRCILNITPDPRENAYKHGSTPKPIVPACGLGADPGAFDKELVRWLDDLKPRNVFEESLAERACRASWKLKLLARYEDALAIKRR